jgi:hypothetical protein
LPYSTSYGSASSYYIQQIAVYYGTGIVNGLQILYSDGYSYYWSSQYASSATGSYSTFSVPNGQFIYSVNICGLSNYIYSIQFTTNLGTPSITFGTTTYSSEVPSCYIVYFPGSLIGFNLFWSNSYLNGISFASYSNSISYTSSPIIWQGNLCDFLLSDFFNYQVTSLQSCASRCATTLGCTHFFFYNNALCYLKYARVATSDARSISGTPADTCGIVNPCNGAGCSSDTTTYYNRVLFLFTQFYGTVSGTIFNEESFLRSNPNYYVYAINVRCGDWIDGIQLHFQNNITNNIITDSFYGGSGGVLQTTFYVPAGQFIASIYICYGTYVYQLLFTTNLGTQSPYYGGYAGTCTTVYFGRPGLLGIAGYYGQYLDLLQFIS